jgi:pimeloyl-ACP methyl ester carboxylesterase
MRPPQVSRTIKTPDGVAIATQEWGYASGPEIVFIHGFSQCHLCWKKQIESELAESFRIVTFDLRGHGDSEKPLEAASYRESSRWAQELHSVIAEAHLQRPVLVGWSYAGRVIGDYLLTYGDDAIAGINFVDAMTKASPEWTSPGGKLVSAMSAAEPDENIEHTLAFLRACTAVPVPPEELQEMLAFNMLTPVEVRSHMSGRPTPYEDTLRKLRVPVLVTHGEKDQIVLPVVGHYTASVRSYAEASFYPESGHMPFWEDASRFNSELATFVIRATKA